MAARKKKPRLEDLLGLWRGDEDSTGYESVKLAHEVCLYLKPVNVEALLRQLYPHAASVDGMPEDGRVCAMEGFKWWQEDRRRETPEAA